jgi:diguanylate cyclase (GGDEF)-like protein/PAS domain S-box-containing protein
VDGEPTTLPAPGQGLAAADQVPGELSGFDVVARLIGVAADRGAAQLALTGGEHQVVAWANPLALDLLGLNGTQVIGAPLLSLGETAIAAAGITGPDDWRMVTEHLMNADGGPAPAAVYRPDATRIPVDVEATVVESAGWVLTLRWTRDGDEAAREAEHRFLALAEHAPVGIVMSEAGARLSYVNRWFERLAGMSQSRLLGTGWLSVIHPEDLPHVNRVVQQVLAGSPAEHTIRIQPVDDGPRWVTLRLAPVTTRQRAAGFIGTAEDVTARRAWEDQLAYQASHDALTGLANRRRLVEALTHLLDGRHGTDRDFALMFCDLDGFKQINDAHGHEAGDRVLIEIANRLEDSARDHDLVARIAGDEFVVILRMISNTDAAERAATRFLTALTKPVRVNGHDVRVSASLGLALPDDSTSPESLLRVADHSMYLAKASGPGSYRVAPASENGPAAALPQPRGPR